MPLTICIKLLIAPEGIEIWRLNSIVHELKLLIAPEGIEITSINEADFSTKLLIAPEGIEISLEGARLEAIEQLLIAPEGIEISIFKVSGESPASS